jgi:hypothetical protein
MSDAALTHKDLADLLKVSETTIKSYRRKFPGCIPVSSQGKPIRFPAVAADVALRIRDLFELGMSVEEVRLRLAEEFSWVSPKSESAKKSGAEKTDLAPELTQGVSNMAKSMVAMAQQQKAILARMQGIESMLEDLGIQGGVDAGAMRQTTAKTTREKEELLEARLGKLDATTRELAGTVASLAQDLGKFLGRREQAAAEWRNSGGINSEEVQAAQEQAAHMGQEPSGAKVIPLRQETAPVSPTDPAQTENRPAEPSRNFLTLPLVVRTGQGQYISAGGRGRGRFCINDLKAMLAYGFTPPHHFVFSWEPHGQGWWLSLEQASAPENEEARGHQLLLMELPTQRGNTVVEILQLKNNGEAVHPAEICTVIDSFGE